MPSADHIIELRRLLLHWEEDQISQPELEALRELLRDSDNRAHLVEHFHATTTIEQHLRGAVAAETQSHGDRPPTKRSGLRAMWWLAATAATLFLAIWSGNSNLAARQDLPLVISARSAEMEGAPLAIGRAIPAGSLLSAGSDGDLCLRWSDGTQTALSGAGTLLVDSAKRLHLQRGSLQCLVAKQANGTQLSVITPHAQVHVIGTVFTVCVDDQATHLTVSSGVVRFTDLTSAMVSEVRAGGSASSGALAVSAPSPRRVNAVVAYNCGGQAVGPFLADLDVRDSKTISNWIGTVDLSAVTNPAPVEVYQTERYGVSFRYDIPGLSAGTSYLVRLHFTEDWYTAPGQRLQNVIINDVPVLTRFDIYAAAGAMHKAIIKEFTATADARGEVRIAFEGIAVTRENDEAKVDGIEIVPAQDASSP